MSTKLRNVSSYRSVCVSVSFSCLSVFFKKFQFPFLASLRFLFVSATLTDWWQPTSVACRSASEVASLLQSSKPRVAHRSRRWRTRKKGRRRRKKGSACFEREKERELEKERQRDRETERQRDRETERQRDRETETERHRERETKQTKAGCSC